MIYHIFKAISQGLFPLKTISKIYIHYPKNLDSSFKMDLGFWDYFGREKPISQQNFIGLI